MRVLEHERRNDENEVALEVELEIMREEAAGVGSIDDNDHIEAHERRLF